MKYRIEVVYDLDENDLDHFDISLDTEYVDYESAIKCYTLLLNAHKDAPYDVYVCLSAFNGEDSSETEEKLIPKYINWLISKYKSFNYMNWPANRLYDWRLVFYIDFSN